MSMNEKLESARKEYFNDGYAWSQSVRQSDGSYVDENMGKQIFDAGERISPNYKMTAKARRLISYVCKQGDGFAMGFNKLSKHAWKAWEGETYTVADALEHADVKSAIKGLYLGVINGEYKWADGKKRMLKLERNGNGDEVLTYVPFIDGLFEIGDAPKSTKTNTTKATTTDTPKAAAPTLEVLMQQTKDMGVSYEDALKALNKIYNK